MIQVDVSEAQEKLKEYLAKVSQGETVVLCEEGRPVAEIRWYHHPAGQPRPLGLAQGQGIILPSFFEPLPNDILDAFEGRGEWTCFSTRAPSSGWCSILPACPPER